MEEKSFIEIVNGKIGGWKKTFSGMDEIAEWDTPVEFMSNVASLTGMVYEVVGIVEAGAKEAVEFVTSKDKRDAAVQAIDDMIKLNPVMEAFDGIIIGMLVDGVVASLNATLWKKVKA